MLRLSSFSKLNFCMFKCVIVNSIEISVFQFQFSISGFKFTLFPITGYGQQSVLKYDIP